MPVLRQSVGFIIAWLTILGQLLITLLVQCHCVIPCGCVQELLQAQQCCFSVEVVFMSKRNQNDSNVHAPISLTTAGRTTTQYIKTRAKELLPFVGVFSPLIIFWAIFYQQNSTWILQGTMMNCQLGVLHVPPG